MNAPLVDWFEYGIPLGFENEPPRPFLQVILASRRRRVVAMALLDSGSDLSLLPVGVARTLGVVPRRALGRVRVFGAVVPAGPALVDLEVPSRAGRGQFAGAEFFVPLADAGLPFVILGRNPVFEQYEVRFRDWQHRFGLVERSRHAVRQGPTIQPGSSLPR